jgi:hypothetical protein
MRIDREAFFLAVAALSGCERVEKSPGRSPSETPESAQLPGVAARAHDRMPATEQPAPSTSADPIAEEKPVQDPAPTPEQEPAPPAPAPRRVTTRHRRSAATRWFLGLSIEERNSVTSVCEQRAKDPCWGVLPTRVDRESSSADPANVEGAASRANVVASLPSDKVGAYCQETFPAPTCDTPLVVAFDGQPVDFSAAREERFAFVPGEPATTDWPTAVTPWIALDRDGDGAITSGAELFGSSTELAGGLRAVNGFAAIAALDANADDTLDERDPMFSRLVLWSDDNGDRRSTPDELRSLADSVSSISLRFRVEPRCNERDDCEGERSALHWRDESGTDHVGAVVDIYIARRR